MRHFFIFAALTSLVLVAAALRAEVPLLKPEERRKLASHIVSAKVVQVYTAQKDSGDDHIDTIYAIEAAVVSVEKGEGLEKGQMIVVKAWRASKRPEGWVGPSGQANIPKVGDRVELFMTGDKGIFSALSPNGIDVVKP